MVFVLKQKRYACVCEIGSSVRLPSNHMLHLNSENSLGNRNNSSCELRGFQTTEKEGSRHYTYIAIPLIQGFTTYKTQFHKPESYKKSTEKYTLMPRLSLLKKF